MDSNMEKKYMFEDVEFDISGASRVSGDIAMRDGWFNVSGASNIDLAGSAGEVNLKVSGASRALLAEFSIKDATVRLSGASSGIVNALGSLDVDLSGASNLSYIGSPDLHNIDVSGGSKLSQD